LSRNETCGGTKECHGRDELGTVHEVAWLQRVDELPDTDTEQCRRDQAGAEEED